MKADPAFAPVSFTRRFAAATLDVLLCVFLFGLANWLLQTGDPLAAAPTADELGLRQVTAVAIAAPAVLLFWFLFQGTPGKLLLGCRIVDARSGSRPTAVQWLVRLFGYLLSALPAGLGFFWIFVDRNRQGWHDKLARTLIVEDDDSRKALSELMAEHR